MLVPDIASAYKSRMKVADLSSKEEIAIFENAKRDVELAGIELKNSLEVVDVTMDPPSLDDTMPDNERLTRALRKYLNISRVRIPYAVLKKLPDVLRRRCSNRWSGNRYWSNNCFRCTDQYGKR